MKFTAGYWSMRPGMRPYYAVHVHDIALEPDALVVYAPTSRVSDRSHTLDQPLLTLRFSSPADNVIRVQMWHHKGGLSRQPSFELKPQPAPHIKIQDDAQAASLTSGQLTVCVEKAGDWNVAFKDGSRVITSSGVNAAGFVDTPDGRFIHEQLALDVGECVYGLGERFTPFVKNGQVVDMWNEDGG
ncbi:MAG: alpha-xylosidase, partial [Anaerolineae bacterium]|nr:alpha-xylosidase [Anaerolineae bacterium]